MGKLLLFVFLFLFLAVVGLLWYSEISTDRAVHEALEEVAVKFGVEDQIDLNDLPGYVYCEHLPLGLDESTVLELFEMLEADQTRSEQYSDSRYVLDVSFSSALYHTDFEYYRLVIEDGVLVYKSYMDISDSWQVDCGG